MVHVVTMVQTRLHIFPAKPRRLAHPKKLFTSGWHLRAVLRFPDGRTVSLGSLDYGADSEEVARFLLRCVERMARLALPAEVRAEYLERIIARAHAVAGTAIGSTSQGEGADHEED